MKLEVGQFRKMIYVNKSNCRLITFLKWHGLIESNLPWCFKKIYYSIAFANGFKPSFLWFIIDVTISCMPVYAYEYLQQAYGYETVYAAQYPGDCPDAMNYSYVASPGATLSLNASCKLYA